MKTLLITPNIQMMKDGEEIAICNAGKSIIVNYDLVGFYDKHAALERVLTITEMTLPFTDAALIAIGVGKIGLMNDVYKKYPILQAVYEDMQNGILWPRGNKDNGGRWYPPDERACFVYNKENRRPSRRFPFSFFHASRTRDYVLASFLNTSNRDYKGIANNL